MHRLLRTTRQREIQTRSGVKLIFGCCLYYLSSAVYNVTLRKDFVFKLKLHVQTIFILGKATLCPLKTRLVFKSNQ